MGSWRRPVVQKPRQVYSARHLAPPCPNPACDPKPQTPNRRAREEPVGMPRLSQEATKPGQVLQPVQSAQLLQQLDGVGDGKRVWRRQSLSKEPCGALHSGRHGPRDANTRAKRKAR